MKIEVKNLDFEIKSVLDDGEFHGYGSVFGNVDSDQEIVAKGAFAESLKDGFSKNRPLPILWQHRTDEPIGVYISVKEDDYGLAMHGRLLVKDVQRASEAHALMKARAVSGLSIGYFVKEDAIDRTSHIRTLKRLDLRETSIVTFPCNDSARIEAVKSIKNTIRDGKLPSLAAFEDFLRESGFSKSQATVVAGQGLSKLLSRSESGGNPSELLQELQKFTQR